MKRFILLLLALWMTLKPLWPLAEYVINYEYIATVLCENREVPEMHCNGKCYLSKMLAQQQAQDQENPFESPLMMADHGPIIAQDISRFSFTGKDFGLADSQPESGFPHMNDSLFVFEQVQPPEVSFFTTGLPTNG